MEVIRTVNGYSLNYDPLQHLYNVSKEGLLSDWMNEEEADILIFESENEYARLCEDLTYN